MDITAFPVSRHLAVATPECVADDFGGEIVVLNLESGLYFSLRGLAAAIWRDLAAGRPAGELLAAIGAADPAVAESSASFVRQLVERGLLRPAEPFGRSAEVLAGEAAESVALVRAGDNDLAFEAYEDMKDLVLADPIHESDESFGWPVPRPEA